MKKIYMEPAVEVIRIETQNLIASSQIDMAGTTDDVNDLLSRDNDFDDDDLELDEEDL